MTRHHMTQHSGGEEPQHPPDDEPPRPLKAWQVIGSTLAAAFGVQSSRNRSRDFGQGKASHFIIAGVLFTITFVLVMTLIVNLVLGSVN